MSRVCQPIPRSPPRIEVTPFRSPRKDEKSPQPPNDQQKSAANGGLKICHRRDLTRLEEIKRRHFTTILTSLSGTTITFTTCLPSMERLHFRIGQRQPLQLLLRRAERHRQASAHFAVDLQHDVGGVFFRQGFIISRPRLPEHRTLCAPAAPTSPRRDTARTAQQQRPATAGSDPAPRATIRFFVVQSVDQLHQRRDRRIEVPAIVEIVGHFVDGLVQFAQRAPVRRGIARTASRSILRVTKRQHAFQEAVRCPPTLGSRSTAMSFSGARRTTRTGGTVSAPYFPTISSGSTTLPLDFDIAEPSLPSTMPCVNSRLRRLVVVDQPEIAHHLGEEARIDQVQNRVRRRRRCIGRSGTTSRSSPNRTAPCRYADRSSDRNTRTNRRTCPWCRSRAARPRRTGGTSRS